MKTPDLRLFFEDEHILVCYKPPHIATQCSGVNSPDMVSLIKNYLCKTKKQPGSPYLAVIHRLDQPVSGILVFAKTPFAAKELNRQLQNHGFRKHYRALVDGTPDPLEGTLHNYLVKDRKTNISKVCTENTPDAKPARLSYKTVRKQQNTSELDILLDTGRHHQIRVQLAALGCPVIGDTKYNPHICEEKKWHSICLCAYKLEFKHPKTQKLISFEIPEKETGYF